MVYSESEYYQTSEATPPPPSTHTPLMVLHLNRKVMNTQFGDFSYNFMAP